MEKKTYHIMPLIRRMLGHMWDKDPAQFGRIAIYTLVAGVYPFMAVVSAYGIYCLIRPVQLALAAGWNRICGKKKQTKDPQ